MALNIRVLGSSSAGNCTVVWDGTQAVLIDCGFSPRYTFRCLRALGLGPTNLGGLLITHTHADHINENVLNYLVEWRTPICAPASVAAVLLERSRAVVMASELNLLQTFPDGHLAVGRFDVVSFPVPHDSPGGCFGFSITGGEEGSKRTVTVATDLGFTQKNIRDRFVNSDAIVIESNHDPDMLENSGRPPWLKERIRKIGHLSNGQCAEFLVDVFQQSLQPPAAVLLAHISQTCNTNALALSCTRDELAQYGFPKASVFESFKMTASKVVCIK